MNGSISDADSSELKALASGRLRCKSFPYPFQKTLLVREDNNLGAAFSAFADFLDRVVLPESVLAVEGVSEGLLTTLWYVGPMNRTPGLDFTSAANGSLTLRYAAIYLALSAALLILAFFGRTRQLRSD